MMMNINITNQNDIFVYFSLINQLKVQKFIDVGMFLKRIGSISRQVKGLELSPYLHMDAYDIFPETTPDIYSTIYNNIYTSFDDITNRYQLAILLRLDNIIDLKTKIDLWIKAMDCSDYILADYESVKYFLDNGVPLNITPISVDNMNYALIKNINN